MEAHCILDFNFVPQYRFIYIKQEYRSCPNAWDTLTREPHWICLSTIQNDIASTIVFAWSLGTHCQARWFCMLLSTFVVTFTLKRATPFRDMAYPLSITSTGSAGVLDLWWLDLTLLHGRVKHARYMYGEGNGIDKELSNLFISSVPFFDFLLCL